MVAQYTSEKKQQARAMTVGAFCPSLVGTTLQYWTLAGPCGTECGDVVRGSEFDWAVKSGLVEPHQFHGVDRDEVVTARNRCLGRGNWYCGDFLDVLLDQDVDAFRPGLINYDSLAMPKKGVPYFAQLLNLVRGYPRCVVVGNFVLRARYWRASSSDVVRLLQQEPLFLRFFGTGRWVMHHRSYCYAGSGPRGNTEMCSVIFSALTIE